MILAMVLTAGCGSSPSASEAYESQKAEDVARLRSAAGGTVIDIYDYTDQELSRLANQACLTARSATSMQGAELAFMAKWAETPEMQPEFKDELTNYLTFAGSAMGIFCPEVFEAIN